MTLEDQERWIERRRAEFGIVGDDYVPPNSGARRTPEKRALLRALVDMVRAQGRKPWFKNEFTLEEPDDADSSGAG